MSSFPENTEASPSPRQQPSISEFFTGAVQSMLHDHLDYVISGWAGESSYEVLHLIDPNPKPGEPIDYHYVYHSVDSRQELTTQGIFIARPSLVTDRAVSRHYLDNGKGLVIRDDRYNLGQRSLEFLQGDALDPVEVSDPDFALVLSDFQNNIFNIRHSTPVRPSSDLFEQFVPIL